MPTCNATDVGNRLAAMSLPLVLGLGLLALAATASTTSSRKTGKRRSVRSGNTSTRQHAPRWKETERSACEARGLRHRGGPGRADCGRTVEVKDWSRPVDAGTVQREFNKGRRTIVAPGGFSKPARAIAQELGVRLRRT